MKFSEEKIKLWTVVAIAVIASYTFLLGIIALDPLYSPFSREAVAIVNILGDRAQPADAVAIANTVLEQSRQTGIPVPIFLAIMKKESSFRIDACSSCKARGIMQIHPVTWDAYSDMLGIQRGREKAFDPTANITVAAAVLTDLLKQYSKRGYKEHRLWDYVLSAYYAGPTAIRGGLNKNHIMYAKRVKEYAKEITLVMQS